MRTRRGFTLTELLVVVTLIALLMGVALPNVIAARLRANESAAAKLLRTVSTAQAQFQRSAYADEDSDGYGEFGTFAEMAGVVGVRGAGLRTPTDLTPSMSRVNPYGEVERSGYLFRIYLPASGGSGVRERPSGGMPPGTVDVDLAESFWACYAWPVEHGASGERTFFVNASGEVLFCTDADHKGPDCSAVRAGSAYLGTALECLTGRPAVGTRGADGNVWKPLD